MDEDRLKDFLRRSGATRSGEFRGPAGETPPPPAGGGALGPEPPPPADSGAAAVRESLEAKKMKEARGLDDDGDDAESGGSRDVVRHVGGKTFYLRGEVWMDVEAMAEAAKKFPRVQVKSFSDEYLALAAKDRGLAKAFALGRVVVLSGGTVYEVVPE